MGDWGDQERKEGMSSQGRRLPRAKGKAETTSSIGGKCPKVRGLLRRPGHPMFPLRSRSGHRDPTALLPRTSPR